MYAWKPARLACETHPVLKKYTKVYRQGNTITVPGTLGVFKPLGRDSDSEDGAAAHFTLVDEYHAHKTRYLIDVMRDSMSSQDQPLELIITTAGANKEGPCYRDERDLVVRILEGSLDPRPEHIYGIIYTLDEGDDYTDPAVWIKANPNLGVSKKVVEFEKQVQTALQMPAKINNLLTKHFNQWTQAETRWILDDVWMTNADPVDEDELEGRPCYVGVDLSTSTDITAAALVFPPTDLDNKFRITWRFFIPEEVHIDGAQVGLSGRSRRDQVPYEHWAEQGLIHVIAGDIIRLDHVEQVLQEDAERFHIMEIAYDPWKAQEFAAHMDESGFELVMMRQVYSTMAGPTDAWEKKVLAGELAHGGNPVARWMMANTEVKSDRQGNIMPMKPKRGSYGKRIDGIVAGIMGLGRAVLHADGEQYADVGVYAG